MYAATHSSLVACRPSFVENAIAHPGRRGQHNDVRIKIHTVGICGSDVHYFLHGEIGPFKVRAPMILGHEASGTIVEVGRDVRHLRVGDRVCMEPGIPDPSSRASRLGLYNLDPAVRFWATPPVHGCLRPMVVHPADFTFKVPDNVSFAEAALVEPLAVGMHSARKAEIRPGDRAVVLGAGPIGMVTTLAAIAGGCAEVIVIDPQQPKLDIAAKLGPVKTIKPRSSAERTAAVLEATDGWGADIVFECSGAHGAFNGLLDLVCPGGRVVLVGMPHGPVNFDVVAAQVKEVRVESIFRYAHVYPRALQLMGSGKLSLAPLITDRFPFEKSIEAFNFAANMPPTSVKAIITL
jgi:D-xylulose reductase